MCSNDGEQIDTICLGRLPSSLKQSLSLQLSPPCVCMFKMKVKKYLIFHCDSFCTVQLEVQRYESRLCEYITHFAWRDERRILKLPTTTITSAPSQTHIQLSYFKESCLGWLDFKSLMAITSSYGSFWPGWGEECAFEKQKQKIKATTQNMSP